MRIPLATFLVNVLGALALGVLLERLARAGPDTGRRRFVRLALGAGALGGFTTYSALALESVSLARDGLYALAVGYALGTVLAGTVAAFAGIALGARIPGRGRP